MRRIFLATWCGALWATPAFAAGQVWPFQFDVNLSPNPSGVQSSINAGNLTLPPLPVAQMETLVTDDGGVTLWFWPETAALLRGIAASDAGVLMTWPATPVMCAQHEAFVLPTLIPPGLDAGSSCASVNTQLQQQLQDLTACTLVEQPELYVASYSPANVRNDFGNIEDMVGVSGEALTHMGLPADGILPPDFVPTMRRILDKIRHDALVQHLQQASARYATATQLANTNSACFDATARATLLNQLSGLNGEVTTALAYLDQLKVTGEATYQQENVCLAARARTRPSLPYPSLTAAERRFIAYWLGGVAWRMRGGGLIPLGSTQDARRYYAQDGFARIAEMLGGADGTNLSQQFLCMLASYGWSQWMDMGTNGTDKYADLVGFSDRGKRQVAGDLLCVFQQSTTQLLSSRGYDTTPVIAGGLQFGGGYYYSYYPNMNYRWATSPPSPYSGWVDSPTAVGEFVAGGSIGAGLAMSLLNGKPSGQPAVNPCGARVCGSDGCGGTCGTCGSGTSCTAAGQCAAPVVDAGAAVMDAGTVDAGARDAGTSPVNDGGTQEMADAGPPLDSGLPSGVTDAGPGVMAGDASVASDGGPSGRGGTGCGCAATPPPAFLGLLSLGWAAARRARRVR